MKRSVMVEVIGILFIILFVYASISKLIDFEKFTVDIGKSPLLTAFSGPVAVLVPIMEIFISILLTSSKWRLPGFYMATCLMMTFTIYIITVLKFADYIPCSCGGILQHMSWGSHIIFNGIFVTLGITAILLYPFKNDRQYT